MKAQGSSIKNQFAWLAGMLLAFGLLIGLAIGLLTWTTSGPTPHSKRGLAELRELAQNAMPLIRALEVDKTTHGRYPDSASALSVTAKGKFEDWFYSVEKGNQSYRLYCKLDWDSALWFEHPDTEVPHWWFDPGDGATPITDLTEEFKKLQ